MSIKINNIYIVNDNDLGINSKFSKAHRVVVVKINKRSKKAIVKTITSLEMRNHKNKYKFNKSKLVAAKYGDILPIPVGVLNSTHYSGIDQREIEVSFKDLQIQSKGKIFKFPRRYKNLIKKK